MKKIYLDYASTTPVDKEVEKAMRPYFGLRFGNPSSLHGFGQEAMAAVDNAREVIAKSIRADFREIIFTGSATEANNLVLRGVVKNFSLGQIDSRNRPRLIVSAIEHESVLETAKDLEKRGVEVVYIPVSKDGLVNLKKLRESLNERTILVSIMYANNEVGIVQNIAEIIRMIRDVQEDRKNGFQIPPMGRASKFGMTGDNFPLFHTDAVQAFQYLDCDVNKLGVDFMTLSAHKIYGPKGIGVLYVKSQTSNTKLQTNYKKVLEPLITGGGQEFGLRSGTENVLAIVGLAKAVELRNKLLLNENKRVEKLRDYFLNELKKIYPKLKVNGSFRNRLPNNLNVAFLGQKSLDLLVKLDLAGVAASSGSACSARVLKSSHVLNAMNLDLKYIESSLRFTLGRGTRRGNIDYVVKVFQKILTG